MLIFRHKNAKILKIDRKHFNNHNIFFVLLVRQNMQELFCVAPYFYSFYIFITNFFLNFSQTLFEIFNSL